MILDTNPPLNITKGLYPVKSGHITINGQSMEVINLANNEVLAVGGIIVSPMYVTAYYQNTHKLTLNRISAPY